MLDMPIRPYAEQFASLDIGPLGTCKSLPCWPTALTALPSIAPSPFPRLSYPSPVTVTSLATCPMRHFAAQYVPFRRLPPCGILRRDGYRSGNALGLAQPVRVKQAGAALTPATPARPVRVAAATPARVATVATVRPAAGAAAAAVAKPSDSVPVSRLRPKVLLFCVAHVRLPNVL